MDTSKIVDEFKKAHGNPEDWRDQGSYMQALGSFTLGWLACEKSGLTPRALDGAVCTCKIMSSVIGENHAEDCALHYPPHQ